MLLVDVIKIRSPYK